MGLLGDFTAYIDSLKRGVKNTLSDTISDPSGMLSRRLSQVSESLPEWVISGGSVMPQGGGELLPRPSPQEWGTNVALNAPTMGLLGHTVYHGSPHKFDKFDASKIGTGEGAQAYGHGLYLADSPTVAAGYKETLSARVKDRLTIDGKVVDPDSMLGRAAEDVPRIGLQATLQKIDDNIKFNEKYAPDMAEMYRGIREKIASLDPSRVSVKEGALYKVDLPDEWLPKMLDWDKPLSQQPKAVRKAVEPIVAPIRKEMAKPTAAGWGDFAAPQKYDPTGAEVLALLRQQKDSGAQGILGNGLGPEVSQRLRDAGIPGIRYLDGGSRGAGEGTRNYVVFPGMEHLLKILSRE